MLGWAWRGSFPFTIHIFEMQASIKQATGFGSVRTRARSGSLCPRNVSEPLGFRVLFKSSRRIDMPTPLQLLLPVRSLATGSCPSTHYRRRIRNKTLRLHSVLPFVRTLTRTSPSFTSQGPPIRKSLVTHPLDFRNLRWTLPRGLWLSLPILALYILFYLPLLTTPDSVSRPKGLTKFVQCVTYQKHEWFQRLSSPIAYVTSQFFHDNARTLIVDSLALFGIATVSGPFIDMKSSFIIYLVGGFIGANVDCAWTWARSPLRKLSGIQYDENIREGQRLLVHYQSRLRENHVERVWDILRRVWVDLKELRENPERFRNKAAHKERCNEENMRMQKLADFLHWVLPSYSAKGSLMCLCKYIRSLDTSSLYESQWRLISRYPLTCGFRHNCRLDETADTDSAMARSPDLQSSTRPLCPRLNSGHYEHCTVSSRSTRDCDKKVITRAD